MGHIPALRALSLRVLPGLIVATLAVHFGFVLAYLTPLNPVKVRAWPVLHAYIVPFFEQRWELFAPDPLVETRHLLVACRLDDGRGATEERPWTNMTAAYRELKHKYRLTPADRIERAQLSSMHMLYAREDELTRKLVEHPDEDSPAYRRAIELINEQRARRVEIGKRLLARAASCECDRIHGSGRTKEVRVRMATTKSPPFSQRTQPLEAGETTYTDFPWAPYEAVAPL